MIIVPQGALVALIYVDPADLLGLVLAVLVLVLLPRHIAAVGLPPFILALRLVDDLPGEMYFRLRKVSC